MKLFFALIGWSVVVGVPFLIWSWGLDDGGSDETLAEEWYQGGSLSGSNLAQWSVATERNKLATASDWIVIVLGENQVRDMVILKRKAGVVANCIDTLIPIVGKSYNINESKTVSTALLCITQLESNNWQ